MPWARACDSREPPARRPTATRSRRAILVAAGFTAASTRRFVLRDRHHEWWGLIAPPLLTCERVISEARVLLGQTCAGSGSVLEMLARGALDDRELALCRAANR